MTKLLNVLIVLLAAVLVFVIVYPQIQQNRPLQVRFACDSTIASLPLIVGYEDSLFSREKIIPTLVFYSDPDKALDDLFAGKLQAGVFPWSTVLKHIAEKGETLRVMFSEDYRASVPVDAMIATAKSPVKTTNDLRGKRLAYPPEFRDYMPVILLNLGLTANDVKLTEVAAASIVSQLDAGAFDAGIVIEPYLCSLDTLAYRRVQPAAGARLVSQPFPGAVFGVSTALLKSSRVAGGRMKVTTDAAVAQIEGKSDAARALLAKYMPVDKDAVAKCRLPELQRLNEINKPSVQALAQRLTTAGVFKSDVDPKGAYIDPATLKR